MLSFGGTSTSSRSYVDKAQQPFLDFTRNLGMGLTGNLTGLADAYAQQAGSNLYGAGTAMLPQLTNNPFLQSLQQQAGGDPALVDRQIGQLGSDLGRAFQQQVIPGIRRDAGGYGALGGSRQQVAQGIAGQGFADAFSRGATDIYAADRNRQLQAATTGGGLLSQGVLGGLSSLQGLYDVGLSQFTGGFAPLSLYSSILGAPTVLDKSRSRGFNVGFGGKS